MASGPLIRILIADPQPVVRRGLKALLDDAARYHVVGEAADFDEALRLAQLTSPMVAILGHILPPLNGIRLSRQVRAASPPTQIVLYAYTFSETVVSAALEAGVQAFVLKADPENDLIEGINAARLGRQYFSTGVSRSFLERVFDPRVQIANRCLTLREREVVELIAQGCTKQEVGARVSMSVKTVETHLTHVMEKLELHNSADLVRFALRNDVIQA